MNFTNKNTNSFTFDGKQYSVYFSHRFQVIYVCVPTLLHRKRVKILTMLIKTG